MVDTQQQQEQVTVTIEDVQGRPKRGRPRKENIEVTVEGGEEPKPKRTRRSNKLKATDVEQMFEVASSGAVMLGAEQFWYINGQEVKPFSQEVADLLNRIPSQYIAGFFDFSGYVTIALGMYMVMKPRIAAQRAVNEQKQEVEEQRTLFNVA